VRYDTALYNSNFVRISSIDYSNMKVLMRTVDDTENVEVEIDGNEDVYTLKVMAGSVKADWSDVDRLRLAWNGQLLRDGDKIASCGIKEGDLVAVAQGKQAYPALPAKVGGTVQKAGPHLAKAAAAPAAASGYPAAKAAPAAPAAVAPKPAAKAKEAAAPLPPASANAIKPTTEHRNEIDGALQKLTSHPWEVQHTAYSTLMKLLKNVCEQPGNEKYRSINPDNGVLKAKVFDIDGGKDLLMAAGFKQENGAGNFTSGREADLLAREAFACLSNHAVKQHEKQERKVRDEKIAEAIKKDGHNRPNDGGNKRMNLGAPGTRGGNAPRRGGG